MGIMELLRAQPNKIQLLIDLDVLRSGRRSNCCWLRRGRQPDRAAFR